MAHDFVYGCTGFINTNVIATNKISTDANVDIPRGRDGRIRGSNVEWC